MPDTGLPRFGDDLIAQPIEFGGIQMAVGINERNRRDLGG